jgi:hypothetical protein
MTGSAAPLRVDSARLDFGEVRNQADFRWTLPVENLARRPILVSRVEGSCSCVRVEPSSFPIGPGETVDVELSLDLTVQDAHRASQAVREYAESIAVFVGDDAVRPAAIWNVRGRVSSAFSLSPGQLDFGDSLIAGMPFDSKTVDVECYAPCQRLHVANGEEFASAVVRQVDDAGRRFEIHVLPNPGLPAGNHEFKLNVTAELGNGETTPPVPLKVAARVLPEFGIRPSFTHLGTIPVGKDVDETISLISRSGRAFSVERVNCDSENVSIEALPAVKGGDRMYRINIRATQSGDQQAEVRFHLHPDQNDVDSSETMSAMIPVQFRYRGADSNE